MNIGLVVHHYDATDGTGGYAVELLSRLCLENEVTLYAAAIRAPVPPQARVVRVPAIGGSAYARILSFPAAFAAVRKKHDIVHAQGWVTDHADVVTAHIVLSAWRTAARRAGIASRTGERVFGGFVTGRERSLLQSAGAVIVPSSRAAQDVLGCYGRSRGVQIVHHGFPDAVPLPDRASARSMFGIPAASFVALYVGDARKGLDQAMRGVAATSGVHLLVASRSRANRYATLGIQLGIEGRMSWGGELDDMRPAYAAADVLLHPTIYDTFAMVVAEAMAYGVPVIVSKEAGISDLITNGESGWILGSGAGEVATALMRLQADRPLRERFIAGGRVVASRRTWNDVAAETLSVYCALA